MIITLKTINTDALNKGVLILEAYSEIKRLIKKAEKMPAAAIIKLFVRSDTFSTSPVTTLFSRPASYRAPAVNTIR